MAQSEESSTGLVSGRVYVLERHIYICVDSRARRFVGMFQFGRDTWQNGGSGHNWSMLNLTKYIASAITYPSVDDIKLLMKYKGDEKVWRDTHFWTNERTANGKAVVCDRSGELSSDYRTWHYGVIPSFILARSRNIVLQGRRIIYVD